MFLVLLLSGIHVFCKFIKCLFGISSLIIIVPKFDVYFVIFKFNVRTNTVNKYGRTFK